MQAPGEGDDGFFLAVHAGAGHHSKSKASQYRSAVMQACMAGAEQVRAGRGPRAAVVAAVRSLEANPLTNAALGSNLTLDGRAECDASIVDSDGNFGAVGAVPGVAFPIEVADLLAAGSQELLPLGRVPPLMLVGDAARRWAFQKGLQAAASPEEAEAWNVTPEARARWTRYSQMIEDAEAQDGDQDGGGGNVGGGGEAPTEAAEVYDTVGALCVDSHGRTAAGVSSGGIAMKFPGRVGEAAIRGSGCWAVPAVPCGPADQAGDSSDAEGSAAEEDEGAGGLDSPRGRRAPLGTPGFACSVTGVGERIMKYCLAQRCAQRLERSPGSAINEVCASALQELAGEPMPNSAGVIAVKVLFDAASGDAVGGDGCPLLEPGSSSSEEGEEEVQCQGGKRRNRWQAGSRAAIHVEFSAVHSASSMAVGFLSSASRGLPTTTLMRQAEQPSGTKRLREQGPPLSMFGSSVVL
mmetsp:Transcript_29962/g.84525  ORF Transcript_29962/g.84525 Transcript_29962/m.84525 type:complete len:466 (+) Transcript_29962:124-1521(+)